MTHPSFPADSLDALVHGALPDWLSAASVDHQAALHRALREQQALAEPMTELLGRLPDLIEFAAPRVEQALAQAGLGRVDVRTCKVRIAHDSVLPTASPHLPAPRHTQVFVQSLLAAALHNFHADETTPSLFRRARLLDGRGADLPLSFERFAKLCRTLDLGGQYQALLKAHLTPADSQAARGVRRLFEQHARAALNVAMRLATLQGQLGQTTYLRLLQVLAPRPIVAATPGTLSARQLFLLGKRVNGVAAFEERDGDGVLVGVVCWIPGDPYEDIASYGSWEALYDTLGGRLRSREYRRFFARFIGQRDRAAFDATLARLLRQTATGRALELDGRHFEVTGNLFEYLGGLRVQTLLDDARVLAVPTDDEDAAARRQRLAGYAEAGLDLLNLVGLFVPVLGEALLVVAALQLGEQVYEGYRDWRLGDREAALEHLFNVAQCVALGVATGVAAAGALRVLQRSAFVDGLAPVRTEFGAVKLADPGLAGYAVDNNDLGVGQHLPKGGKWYLRTHEATFEVAEDTERDIWTLRHPQRPHAAAPTVEHNGSGGWRHALETPHEWAERTLLVRRLSSRLSDVDDVGARHLVEACGFDDAQLRQLHLQNAPAPARLLDLHERYTLHLSRPWLEPTAFEEALGNQQRVADAEEAVLMRDFPSLSVRCAREVLDTANDLQLTALRETRRVPLSLAERARWLAHDARVDRACLGLRLEQVVSADTERLAVHLLDSLAPWPSSLRIELRGAPDGQLLLTRGEAGAASVIRILRERGGYRVGEVSGQGLVQALDSTLGLQQRQALDAAAGLADVLAHAAAKDRQQVAKWLGMVTPGTGLRPPRRFGDGRVGYALSGRPEPGRQSMRRGIHQIYPTLTTQQLDTYLLDLMARRVDLWEHYATLQDQLARLRLSLQGWRNEADGVFGRLRRLRVSNAIRRSWRRKLTDDGGDFILEIENEPVGSLPAMPADIQFPHVLRLRLRGMGLTELDGDFLQRFPNLVELDLRNNRLTSIPPGVERLVHLRQLHLSRNAIVMDLAGSRRLAPLTRLQTLDLSANPLGSVPDLEGLRSLRRILLRATGLERLPDSVRQLSWRGFVDMRENRLTQLRTELRNLRSRIALHDNPLDEVSETSLDEAAGVSPGSARGSAGYVHAVADADTREQWLGTETGERRDFHLAVWNQLHQEPGSSDLFRFLADFADSEDFAEHSEHFRRRVWHVLEACASHESLRVRLFREAGGPRTCEDRLLLVLSQLEVSILAEQATLGGKVASEQQLVHLGLSLWRLDEVDRIATRHIERLRALHYPLLDEVETRMAYRVNLAPKLGLPRQPAGMHYESFAKVSREDIRQAEQEVLRNETTAAVVDSLAERPFWQNYVHERFAERFEALAAPFHQRLDGYLQEVDDIGEQAYLNRCDALMKELQLAEQALVQQLAQEAYDRVFPD